MENIDFEDYTLPDLFTLLSFLHCEEFPTATLSKKKARVVEVIGEQLGVENKEVIWMVEARKKKRLRQKMADEAKRKRSYQTQRSKLVAADQGSSNPGRSEQLPH